MLGATDLSAKLKLWMGEDWVSLTGDNYFDDLNPEDDEDNDCLFGHVIGIQQFVHL